MNGLLDAISMKASRAVRRLLDLSAIEQLTGSGIVFFEEPPATSGWKKIYSSRGTPASGTWFEVDLTSILPANVKGVLCAMSPRLVGDTHYQSLDVYVRPANLTDTEDAVGFHVHHSSHNIGATPGNEINVATFFCFVPLPGSGADDGKFDMRFVYENQATIGFAPRLEIVAYVQ